jgi:hypothetical protein
MTKRKAVETPKARFPTLEAGIPVSTARLWLGPNTLLRKACSMSASLYRQNWSCAGFSRQR